MEHIKNISIIMLLVVSLTLFTIKIYASENTSIISESEVESAIQANGEEKVLGNLVIWFICAMSFLKVAQKMDSYISSLGINVGHTGGQMLGETMAILKTVGAVNKVGQGIDGGGGSKGSSGGMFDGFSGGLAGIVGRQTTQSAIKGATGENTNSIGSQLFNSSMNGNQKFANDVIGSVAKGDTNKHGIITGEKATDAFNSYFGSNSQTHSDNQSSQSSNSRNSSLSSNAENVNNTASSPSIEKANANGNNSETQVNSPAISNTGNSGFSDDLNATYGINSSGSFETSNNQVQSEQPIENLTDGSSSELMSEPFTTNGGDASLSYLTDSGSVSNYQEQSSYNNVTSPENFTSKDSGSSTSIQNSEVSNQVHVSDPNVQNSNFSDNTANTNTSLGNENQYSNSDSGSLTIGSEPFSQGISAEGFDTNSGFDASSPSIESGNYDAPLTTDFAPNIESSNDSGYDSSQSIGSNEFGEGVQTIDSGQSALDSNISHTNIEIGGGKVTGTEINPDNPTGVDFAMYNAEQFTKPSDDFNVVEAIDGSKWYKQYAVDSVKKTPYEKEDDSIAYKEEIVKKLPQPPKRKDKI